MNELILFCCFLENKSTEAVDPVATALKMWCELVMLVTSLEILPRKHQVVVSFSLSVIEDYCYCTLY